MNEGLQERFGRGRNAYRPEEDHDDDRRPPPTLNLKIRAYSDDAKVKGDGNAWLERHEFPSSEEILDTEVLGLMPNKPKEQWESNEACLSANYELLREDALRNLIEAVQGVKENPTASEDAFNGAVGIYEKVHICGVTCSPRGIALRVTFSLHRTGKQILWEQSKRLITGGLVVLTPSSDMFQTKAIVATVAARPLAGLQQNPPEVDLFISRPEDQELDPAIEFIMVEDRGGMYEASRHTLLALQKLMREPFPLSEHLVDAESSVPAPKYVRDQPKFDLTPVLKHDNPRAYQDVHVLDEWPAQPESNLDASQLAALQRILTKQLAIVQGPPGTGKTFVSVQAIKIMLANRRPGDPPIIIACQTNHAIDQILRHIAEFEPEFIRLGGRSKDRGVIKSRTLYEVRQQSRIPQVSGTLQGGARKTMTAVEKEIGVLLSPLQPSRSPLDLQILKLFGLLTQRQVQTLESGASEWVHDQLGNDTQSPFVTWLGRSLVKVPPKQLPEESFFEFEEADLEFEQLRELEAENAANDDEDIETLKGTTLDIADNFTCRKTPGMTEAKAIEALKQQDMWAVPETTRPAVYRYLQTELKKKILNAFRESVKVFNYQASKRRIGGWERDEPILKEQAIIGMTTTGLSKYRGLVASLQPKVVLIEEAAETLEASVIVACMPSLQHLILVGDYKQLRPHCNVKQLGEECYLNISLFERLINNKVEWTTLTKQRRMRPEIRRILFAIYKDLITDHDYVLDPANRPDVPGMGGINSFFFTHEWWERRDEQMSSYNPAEAEMVVGMFEYLAYNGIPAECITVLTFYNGQRKKILKELRGRASLLNQRFNVVTVDSYQGEENKVVLLSLVRSNDRGRIGFLDVINRVCVALSRAQCGFYIFGNATNLQKSGNKTWDRVIKIMKNKNKKGPEADLLTEEPKNRVGDVLTLQCTQHGNWTTIRDVHDFDNILGGCTVKCGGQLDCGHPCELVCHPFTHEMVMCKVPCERLLSCGHKCNVACGEECECAKCGPADMPLVTDDFEANAPALQTRAGIGWHQFAQQEERRYVAAAASMSVPVPRRVNKPPTSGPSNTSSTLVTKSMQLLDLDEPEPCPHPTPQRNTVLVEETNRAQGKRRKHGEKFVVGGSHLDREGSGDNKPWSSETSLLD